VGCGTFDKDFLEMVVTPRLLAAARALAGLTQAELAESAKVSMQVIQRFEAGNADPRLSSLQALERALREANIEIVGPSDRYLGGVMLIAPKT
jgi:predicted transcriptional regulator